jgi:hypothetical protein
MRFLATGLLYLGVDVGIGFGKSVGIDAFMSTIKEKIFTSKNIDLKNIAMNKIVFSTSYKFFYAVFVKKNMINYISTILI